MVDRTELIARVWAGSGGLDADIVRFEGKTDHGYTQTPEWVVQMDDILSSNIKDFDKFAQLVAGNFGESYRTIEQNVSAGMLSSSSIVHTNLILVLLRGPHIPKLETQFDQNINIKKITVKHLINNAADVKEDETIEYSNCYIVGLKWFGTNYYGVSIKVNGTRVHKMTETGNDGKPSGNTASQTDMGNGDPDGGG